MACLTSGTNPITELDPNPQEFFLGLGRIHSLGTSHANAWLLAIAVHQKIIIKVMLVMLTKTYQVRCSALSATYFCTQTAVISQLIGCSFFYTEKRNSKS